MGTMNESAPLDWVSLSGAKPKGKRPYFFDDPAVERVLAITMAVAQEVSVLHERLDTIERLLEKNGGLKRTDIDAYTPDPDAAQARAEWTRAYIAKVLRIVQQELEAIAKPEENYSLDEKAEQLKKE